MKVVTVDNLLTFHFSLLLSSLCLPQTEEIRAGFELNLLRKFTGMRMKNEELEKKKKKKSSFSSTSITRSKERPKIAQLKFPILHVSMTAATARFDTKDRRREEEIENCNHTQRYFETIMTWNEHEHENFLCELQIAE